MTVLEVPDALRLLAHGEIAVAGRIVEASNATLFCEVSLDGVTGACVHKPVAGERPLWDFPDGTLAGREVAAYLLSEATGWSVVPPTVLRDGPFGPDMTQLWVERDEEVSLIDVVPAGSLPSGWLRVVDASGFGGESVTLTHRDDPDLRRMAVFDVVANNADRKGGHVLPLPGGGLRGVDHGLCFNVADKLRTVLWGWAGEAVEGDECDVLERVGCELEGGLGAALAPLLSPAEMRATGYGSTGCCAAGDCPVAAGAGPPSRGRRSENAVLERALRQIP